jgi:integrase
MPLRLKKRGDIWHYSGTVAGRRLRGSTKTAQKAEAEKLANDIERRWLDRDRHGPGASLTFAQAAIEYRNVKGDKRYLDLVEDHWRDTLVKDINRGAITKAAVTLLPKGSGAYRNRAVVVPTMAVINFASSLDLCPPVRATRFQEVFRKREPVDWPWIQAFMAHASPHLGALACFMFLTGARISEALAVLWGDVDLPGAVVRIRMGKLGGEERFARLPPALVAAIANIPGDREQRDQVFPYASYGACRDPWNVAVRRAGIKALTPHCCRHGFATGMLHAGIDPVTVADLGGWKSPAQLFKTYGHARKDKTLPDLLTGRPQANADRNGPQYVDNKGKIERRFILR